MENNEWKKMLMKTLQNACIFQDDFVVGCMTYWCEVQMVFWINQSPKVGREGLFFLPFNPTIQTPASLVQPIS